MSALNHTLTRKNFAEKYSGVREIFDYFDSRTKIFSSRKIAVQKKRIQNKKKLPFHFPKKNLTDFRRS